LRKSLIEWIALFNPGNHLQNREAAHFLKILRSFLR